LESHLTKAMYSVPVVMTDFELLPFYNHTCKKHEWNENCRRNS